MRFSSLKIVRDEEGQTLVFVAVCMVLLLGFVGLATDVGMMLRQRRVAQTVADSAAIAAASESFAEGNPSTVSSGIWASAVHDATLNGLTPGASNGTANTSNGVTLTVVTGPNITVSGFNTLAYEQATVNLNTGTFFMRLFGFNFLNVSATAVASNGLPAAGCFDVQNGNNLASPAAELDGSSTIFGNDCGVTINGNLNFGSGGSSIQAEFVAVSGTINNTSGIDNSPWSENDPPTNDPEIKLQSETPTVPKGTLPGGNCTAPTGSGMSCIYDYNSGTLTGTLQQNTIYYFDSNVNSGNGPILNAPISGTQDTIFLAGNIPFTFATSGNGNMTITPPGYGGSCQGSSNPLCGVVIDAPTDGDSGVTQANPAKDGVTGTYSCSKGHGNNGTPGQLYFDFGASSTDLEGIIYAPYMQMYLQDQGAKNKGATTLDTDVIIGNFCGQAGTVTVNGYNQNWSPLSKVELVY